MTRLHHSALPDAAAHDALVAREMTAVLSDVFDAIIRPSRTCPACDGTGLVGMDSRECTRCAGMGRL